MLIGSFPHAGYDYFSMVIIKFQIPFCAQRQKLIPDRLLCFLVFVNPVKQTDIGKLGRKILSIVLCNPGIVLRYNAPVPGRIVKIDAVRITIDYIVF